jgi:hypothetical protein
MFKLLNPDRVLNPVRVDQMVYKLYDLMPEEIVIVEGK